MHSFCLNVFFFSLLCASFLRTHFLILTLSLLSFICISPYHWIYQLTTGWICEVSWCVAHIFPSFCMADFENRAFAWAGYIELYVYGFQRQAEQKSQKMKPLANLVRVYMQLSRISHACASIYDDMWMNCKAIAATRYNHDQSCSTSRQNCVQNLRSFFHSGRVSCFLTRNVNPLSKTSTPLYRILKGSGSMVVFYHSFMADTVRTAVMKLLRLLLLIFSPSFCDRAIIVDLWLAQRSLFLLFSLYL